MIVVHIARKPVEGTVASNAVKHGTGGLNIDGARIGTADNLNGGAYASKGTDRPEGYTDWGFKRGDKGNAGEFRQPSGRWPANLVLEHLSSCQLVGTRTEPGYVINRWTDGAKPFGGGAGHEYLSEEIPSGSVEVWQCASGCPVATLDEQSGDRRSTMTGRLPADAVVANPGRWRPGSMFCTNGGAGGSVYADSGGASRFFKQFQSPS